MYVRKLHKKVNVVIFCEEYEHNTKCFVSLCEAASTRPLNPIRRENSKDTYVLKSDFINVG